MDTGRSNIFEELIKLGPLCSGKLSERYIPCGKKNCRCKDSENPQLHGPYYTWVRYIAGKQINRTLCPGPELEMVKVGIENYARFQSLICDLLRRDEESVVSAYRAVKDEGKKNSGKIYRRSSSRF
jgi:hypothetical protein